MDDNAPQIESQEKKPWRVWLDSTTIKSASQVGPRGLAVFMVLLCYSNADHGPCWPNEHTIGENLGMSARSVRDVIAALEAAGWICVTRNKGIANQYSFPPIDTGRNLPHLPKVTGNNLQGLGKKSSAGEEEIFRTTEEEIFLLTEPMEHNPLTKPINKTQGRGKAALGVDEQMPDVLFSSEEFQAAWEAWKQHRKEKGKKLTPTSTTLQFKELAEWGTARAVAAIQHSIKKGWTGIFEPNGDSKNGNGNSNGRKSFTTGPGQQYDPNFKPPGF